MGRNRARDRSRAWARGASGPSYDADAQAYITATGALFPDDLNTLVLGLKSAGLWDDYIGSLKLAIGVPSLAASMIDLRNTAFNGTAVNTPTHSATDGWGFTAASSQYINSGWQVGSANSKATQDSVHVGARIRAGGGNGQTAGASWIGATNFLGFYLMANSNQFFGGNSTTLLTASSNPVSPGNYIGTRTGAAAMALYKNGSSIATSSAASTGVVAANMYIGAGNNFNTFIERFFNGRISAWHIGAGLDASQAAALNTLLDAYATACGET